MSEERVQHLLSYLESLRLLAIEYPSDENIAGAIQNTMREIELELKIS